MRFAPAMATITPAARNGRPQAMASPASPIVAPAATARLRVPRARQASSIASGSPVGRPHSTSSSNDWPIDVWTATT